jgi:HD-GYP domain-containing protein (c-di-GMP phosphodiesterase class II)
MGGDEFCILAPADGDPQRAVATAAAALSEQGEGFNIAASYGFVVIPDHTSEPSAALGAADRRMYRHKNRKRTSASRQTADALLRVLIERNPILAEHGDNVAALVAQMAQALHLPDDEAHQLEQAAELHDIGKLAIPDAILNKRGALDEHEWAFIKQHTMIGERILAAAPALDGVARIVRSSHEHWDGGGYPDGLTGAETTLGARIIHVCDAYDAMTSDRPYRTAMSPEVAVATLTANAGTQFDPTLVHALRDILETAAVPPVTQPS